MLFEVLHLEEQVAVVDQRQVELVLEDATVGVDGANSAAADLVSMAAAASLTTSSNIVLQTITAATTIATDSTTTVFVQSTDGATANVAAAIDLFESSGALTLTHAANIAANDTFLFLWDDNTDSYLSTFMFAAADNEADGADAIADLALEGDNLVIFKGVNDATTITAADLALVA